MNYIFILVSVFLSAFSQLILRYGMTRPSIAASMSGTTEITTIILSIAKSPFIIAGFVCYGVSVAIWLYVLSKTPVSFAYPFVSLGIVITTIAGTVILNEVISFASTAGISLIVAGIILIAIGRA